MQNNKEKPKLLPCVNFYTATYENIYVNCPYENCRKQSIFSRASDPKKFVNFDRAEVICQHCGKEFTIRGDPINENYEYLILDCLELIEQKKYMYCILNLCQACEMCFVAGIGKKLLWEPWNSKVFEKKDPIFTEKRRKIVTNLDILNKFNKQIRDKVKNYGYVKLRNVFLDLYLNKRKFKSCESIEDYLKVMDCYAKQNLSEQEIKEKSSGTLQKLFTGLSKLTIHEVRNKVVHKDGYRPKLSDVERNFKKVGDVVIGLKRALKLDDRPSNIIML